MYAFSDKVINPSFADKVASEKFQTCLALYYAVIYFSFWLYLQMRPELTEVISGKELCYIISCQENTKKLYSKPFFQIILFWNDDAIAVISLILNGLSQTVTSHKQFFFVFPIWLNIQLKELVAMEGYFHIIDRSLDIMCIVQFIHFHIPLYDYVSDYVSILLSVIIWVVPLFLLFQTMWF